MRAIVTGAYGFAGRHLVAHLLEQGDDVLATSIQKESESLGCPAAVLDVCNLQECSDVLNASGPDVVYHLAGIAFAPDAQKNFTQALTVNVEGTFNVYQACSQLEKKVTIIQVSSSEIYGKVSANQLPIDEETPVRALHNYSLTKAMAELVNQRFSGTPNIRGILIRAFNHIGPGQRVDFVVSSFASQLAAIARGKSEPVMHVGNLNMERDFTDVRDIVRGYRLAAQHGSGIYNLCSGQAISVQSILDRLIRIAGTKVEVKRDPARMRPNEIPRLYGSYEKARRELGWQPERTDLDASLKDVYEYWYGRV